MFPRAYAKRVPRPVLNLSFLSPCGDHRFKNKMHSSLIGTSKPATACVWYRIWLFTWVTKTWDSSVSSFFFSLNFLPKLRQLRNPRIPLARADDDIALCLVPHKGRLKGIVHGRHRTWRSYIAEDIPSHPSQILVPSLLLQVWSVSRGSFHHRFSREMESLTRHPRHHKRVWMNRIIKWLLEAVMKS